MAASPAAVAQRLVNLLYQFPAASIGGVEWCTLARKYEERHGGRLDLAALGHSSALAAASTLLWEVLRLADSKNADNPVVAIDDAAALTPRVGSLATWPSLYKALCAGVLSHGTVGPAPTDDAVGSDEGASWMLLSKLKPLLLSLWHGDFDEGNVTFLLEDGNPRRLKKMKHLINAVICLRDARVEWQQSSGTPPTEVDDALVPSLSLAASAKHNDMILCCLPAASGVPRCPQQGGFSEAPGAAAAGRAQQPRQGRRKAQAAQQPPKAKAEMADAEKAELRAENQKLRSQLDQLARQQQPGLVELGRQRFEGEWFQQPAATPEGHGEATEGRGGEPPSVYEDELYEYNPLDDPFEPPPEQVPWWAHASPASSSTTATTSCPSTSPGTPMSAMSAGLHFGWDSGSAIHSGAMTPVLVSAMPFSLESALDAESAGTTGTLGPMGWLQLQVQSLGDRYVIPSGIVERGRSLFDALAPVPLVPATS